MDQKQKFECLTEANNLGLNRYGNPKNYKSFARKGKISSNLA